MKELAEQAATGTYTTAQREIINSEYQAMAAEIDRISNATNFNGIKLLDGSVTNQHGGQGLKIHFGVSNKASEDYYFVNIGDARATSSTGLRIGGDAKNDIWGQGAAGSGPLSGPGCCTAGYSSLDGQAGFVSGETFSYGYNWDWTENSDSALLTGRYLAGRYTVTSSDSLQSLINKVNDGTQSRVGVELDASALQTAVLSGGTVAVCLGDEAYYWGATSVAVGGTQYTSTFVYSTSTSSIQQGSGGVYAVGALRALLQAATNVNVTSTVAGSESATVGLGALLSQLRSNLTGSALLSATTLAADTLGTAAFFAALGITSSIPLFASANFGTGIYSDGGSNYTTSASLANALGFDEVTMSIGSAITATAGLPTINPAFFTALGLESAINKSSGSINTGIYVSGNYWTNSATIATVLNAKQISIDVEGWTLRQKDAADFITQDDIIAMGFVSGQTTAFIGSGDIYVSAATGIWTHQRGLACALAFDEVIFTTSTNTLKSGYNEINLTLNSAYLQSQLPSFNFTQASASLKLGVFLDTIGGSAWTQDYNTWQKMLGLAGGVYGGIEFTINYAANAASGWNTLATLVNDAMVAYQNSNNFTFNREITQVGDGYTEALKKYKDALAGTGTIHGYNTELFKFGDTFADMTSKFWTAMPAGVVAQVTSIAGHTLTDLQASLSTAVTGLTNRITTRAITEADLPASFLLVDNVIPTDGPVLETQLEGAIDSSKQGFQVADMTSNGSSFTATALAEAINGNENSQFWAMVQSFDSNGRTADMVYIFTKEGGNFNDLLACDVAGSDSASRRGLDTVNFENVATAEVHDAGTNFSLGGEYWAKMKPTQTKANLGNEVWNITLEGRDVGSERDIWIANAGDITTPNLNYGIINGMDRYSFVEIQNAADSPWAGGEVRTQSAAQAALDAITESINTKDKIRADLGALQNRLENTMTNLTVQAENLQASESRISDVDVATEMTEFTRNNVLAQAATSMLAQANSLSQLALSLIG
jgi:flagellin-like hook-associated protein FlgL